MNGSSASIEKDVVFSRHGDAELKLDVYHPVEGTSKRTAVIQFHGGGFTRGAKESIAANCRQFAERGYTSLAAQYRLAPGYHWPAQLQDAKAAIRWARANAERLGVDPDKITVAGYSAGATLALIAAGSAGRPDLGGNGDQPGVSDAVAACIAYYPQARRRRPEPDSGDSLLEAGAPDADYEQASSITHMGPHCPPTVFFHATADTTIPFEASTSMFAALRDAGVPAEMHIFDGLSHVFDRHPEFAAPTIEICDLFLDRHVVEPRVYPPFTAGAARPG